MEGDAAAPAAAEPAPAPAAEPAVAPVATTASLQDIHVPDIGSSGKAKIIELLIKVGDTVEVDQSLLVLESDKASMEIPSPAAGVVESLTNLHSSSTSSVESYSSDSPQYLLVNDLLIHHDGHTLSQSHNLANQSSP